MLQLSLPFVARVAINRALVSMSKEHEQLPPKKKKKPLPQSLAREGSSELCLA